MNQLANAKAAANRHWLVSLAPSSVDVCEARRGLGGWRIARRQRHPVDGDHDLVPQLERVMALQAKAWALAARVEATVVVAPDMLGSVLSSEPAGTETGSQTPFTAALPFAANDVSVSRPTSVPGRDRPAAGASAARLQQAFWIHADWQMAIRQTLAAAGLDVVELHARAQVFAGAASAADRGGAGLVAILEADHSYDGVYLHVFAPSGVVVRTTCIARQEPAAAGTVVAQELSAIVARVMGADGVHSQTGHPALMSPLARERVQWPAVPGFVLGSTSTEANDLALLALWRSSLEGIELRPTWPRLQQRLQVASLAIGLVGAGAYGAMIWHGRQLDAEIEQLRVTERKVRPAVQAVQRQREQALFMSSTLASAHHLAQVPRTQVLEAVGDLAAAMPAQATVSWLKADDQTLVVAGTVTQRNARFPDGLALTGFEPGRPATPPDFVVPARQAFAVEFRRKAAPPAAASAAPAPALVASGAVVTSGAKP